VICDQSYASSYHTLSYKDINHQNKKLLFNTFIFQNGTVFISFNQFFQTLIFGQKKVQIQ